MHTITYSIIFFMFGIIFFSSALDELKKAKDTKKQFEELTPWTIEEQENKKKEVNNKINNYLFNFVCMVCLTTWFLYIWNANIELFFNK